MSDGGRRDGPLPWRRTSEWRRKSGSASRGSSPWGADASTGGAEDSPTLLLLFRRMSGFLVVLVDRDDVLRQLGLIQSNDSDDRRPADANFERHS